MGMFDYIHVETTLPQVPETVVSNWGGSDKIAFQTKDTPNQAMSAYKIDDAGQLWVEEREVHWEEGPPAADDAGIGAKFAALGKFVTHKKWWSAEYFSGSICFYESYNHPDYHDEHLLSDTILSDNKFLRFERGWIEYTSLFQNGKLVGDITLVEHTEPKKLSDEELAERIAQNKKRREENEIQQRKRRRETPTQIEKLIDNIDRECKLTETIMDESDLATAISNIRLHIKDWRQKYDNWY